MGSACTPWVRPTMSLVLEGIGLFFQYGQKVIQIGQQAGPRPRSGAGPGRCPARPRRSGRSGSSGRPRPGRRPPGPRRRPRRGGSWPRSPGCGPRRFWPCGGPFRHLRRDEAALRHGPHGGQLHLEPAGKLVLFGPDPGHDLTAVSGNHRLISFLIYCLLGQRDYNSYSFWE